MLTYMKVEIFRAAYPSFSFKAVLVIRLYLGPCVYYPRMIPLCGPSCGLTLNTDW